MADPIGRDEDGVVCLACLSNIGPCTCVIDCAEPQCTGWKDDDDDE